MPVEPGQMLSHYRLIEKIGEGGKLHQLVDETANALGISSEKPAAYQKMVDEVLRCNAEADLASAPTAGTSDRELLHDVASKDDYAGAEEIIREHCEQEWPEDFQMRAYCIDEQEKALESLRHGAPKDLPAEVFARIRRKCAAEWTTDFNMQHYCEQEQLEAYRKLQRRR